MKKYISRMTSNFTDYSMAHSWYILLITFYIIVHTLIFLYATFTGMQLLAIFNISSVILYCITTVFINHNLLELTFYCIEFEIIFHSIAVSLLLENDIGFSMYLIMLVPISFFFLYLAQCKLYTVKAIICSLIAFLIYLICNTEIKNQNAVYNIEKYSSLNTFVFFINCILIFGGLALFSSLFVISIVKSMNRYDLKYQMLDDVASHDPLTKLNNRRNLESHMKNIIAFSELNDKIFSILMCDIDDFKKVNDKYGHENGDIVLKEIANILIDMTRPGDYICRWGGEEFLLVLSNIGLETAAMVAERIRKNIETHLFILDKASINCTITIGVSEYNHDNSYEELFDNADQKLYYGKAHGKNTVISILEKNDAE